MGTVDKQMLVLKNQYERCKRCDLHKSRNRLVFGEPDRGGNATKYGSDYTEMAGKVFFIGEAPGITEDAKGLPFRGRAGDLFSLIVNHDPVFTSYFVTNVVLCKPHGKDKPKAIHWTACRERLLEQIRLIDPAVIVCMGNYAMKGLLGSGTSVIKAREKIHYVEIPGRVSSFIKPVIVTYHPSGVQRKGVLSPGSQFDVMMQDMQEAKKVASLWARATKGRTPGEVEPWRH